MTRLWPKWYQPPSQAPRPFFIERACIALGITRTSLLADSRQTDIVRARFAIEYVAKKMLGWTYCQTGRAMARDHSTVMHGVRRAKQLYKEDDSFAAMVRTVEAVAL